jgi:hypothetical protein
VTKHGVGRRADKRVWRPARFSTVACWTIGMAGLFAFASPAQAQVPATVNVAVDATAAGSPLERVWPFHGYDEIN